MGTVTSRELRGKAVFSQDGRQLGLVEGIEVSHSSWRILGFDVKLKREVLGEMKLKKPMMGTQSVAIGPEEISGIGDAVILKHVLGEVEHSGGKAK